MNVDINALGPDWKKRWGPVFELFTAWGDHISDGIFVFLFVETQSNSFKIFYRVDTVVMNPPFGTKHNKGLDMKFLQVNKCHFVQLV